MVASAPPDDRLPPQNLEAERGVLGSILLDNEVLHDESAAFAVDRKYPESDHAPVLARFNLA